jgi:hypothetical protein
MLQVYPPRTAVPVDPNMKSLSIDLDMADEMNTYGAKAEWIVVAPKHKGQKTSFAVCFVLFCFVGSACLLRFFFQLLLIRTIDDVKPPLKRVKSNPPFSAGM